ncbi:MAG: helix-turn-helix domain-containing protein [Planctomycetes bacterium]|nr:helix-turn-helix domain-containing protein [Planctomycetota bacterium]
MRQRPTVDTWLTFGLTCWSGEPVLFSTFHRHQEVELLMVDTGGLDYLMGALPLRLGPGRLALFWGAMPHKLIGIDPGTTIHVVTVPLARFLQWRLPSGLAKRVVAGSVVLDRGDDRIARDAASFSDWRQDLASGDGQRCELALLEIEARLRRLAMVGIARRRGRDDGGDVPGRARVAPVERMMSFVSEHCADNIGVTDVARAADLHPDYASALFRRVCGIGLAAYIAQHRIAHAQRLLATTPMKVIDIAFACGFGSASRFYAVFRRECGQSPHRFRATVQRPPA